MRLVVSEAIKVRAKHNAVAEASKRFDSLLGQWLEEHQPDMLPGDYLEARPVTVTVADGAVTAERRAVLMRPGRHGAPDEEVALAVVLTLRAEVEP